VGGIVQKPPPVDAKTALIVPIAAFGVFAFIAVVIAVVGILKRPVEPPDPPGTIKGDVEKVSGAAP
jgi:hypothetical protein